MVKTSVVILTIAFVLASAYAILIIADPQLIAGSTLDARSGQKIGEITNDGYLATLIAETRHMGVFAATTAICVWFVLFGPYRRKESWAWWLVLVIAVIVWGYGIIVNAIEADALNLILHIVCAAGSFVGLLLPIKEFFPGK